MRNLHPHQATPQPTMPLIIETKCATCQHLYENFDVYCASFEQKQMKIETRTVKRNVIVQCDGYVKQVKKVDDDTAKGEDECDTIH